MANLEQDIGKIKYVIDKLRYITTAVQVAPFIYTAVYIITLILYMFISEPARYVLDTLFYVSPIVVCMFLIESRILKLCRWHRLACILPVLPQIFVFVDHHIIELTEFESYISMAIPLLLSIFLLVAAYNVFMK